MKSLDHCPRCSGTLLIDEHSALRCICCGREQPKDDGTAGDDWHAGYYGPSPTSLMRYGRRHSARRATNPIAEMVEDGA